jgi:hypothetical protein
MDKHTLPMSGRNSIQHLKEKAKILCEYRCSYTFEEAKEREIIDGVKRNGLISEFVNELIAILNGEDGNLRIGAAELLGLLTPPSLKNIVTAELEKHLTDKFVRDYAYAGAQGDEEDVRTVAKAAEDAIHKLQLPAKS